MEKRGEACLKSLTVGQIVGAEWEYRATPEANWRTRMNHLLNSLDAYGIGLPITVDEVDAELDEMVTLAAVYQHFVSEGRKVGLMMAGLAHQVSRLVNHKSASFLRRASCFRLGRINDDEIEYALLRTIADAGRSIDDDALAHCVSAIEGFPYMMQLVGFRTWDQHPERSNITLDDAVVGAALARSPLEHGVLESTFASLSAGDRQFLGALCQHDKPCTLAEVSQTLGKRSNITSKYKARLIERRVIEQDPFGKLVFSLPFMREYVIKMLAMEG